MQKQYYYRYLEASDGLDVRIYLHCFEVLRHTPKGVWLNIFRRKPRFVLNSSKRKYACPTLEEARESFKARKRRQASIYAARERYAREALHEFEAAGCVAKNEDRALRYFGITK